MGLGRDQFKPVSCIDCGQWGHANKETYDLCPLAPKRKCANCKQAAILYCVECAKMLCRSCKGHLHHPGMVTETHSIERFIQTSSGVRLISPLWDKICVCSVI